jgi:hypothetical protein
VCELIADGYEIDTGLEQSNGTRVSQEVGRDIRGNARIGIVRDRSVLRKDSIDPVPR